MKNYKCLDLDSALFKVVVHLDSVVVYLASVKIKDLNIKKMNVNFL